MTVRHGVLGSHSTPASPFVARSSRSHRLVACSASGFKARWSLDVRFGGKMEAVGLLQEWVSTVGAAAGLSQENTSLNTGSIGAPESTLELEVSFDSLGELEEFWSSIPQAQHKAWGQRMQQFIVHGSPQWQVYRCLPAFVEAAPPLAAVAAGGVASTRSSSGASSNTSSRPGGLAVASMEEIGRYTGEAAEYAATLPTTQQQTASGLSVVSSEEEVEAVLDWKGDPMTMNPGDKMPFKLL